MTALEGREETTPDTCITAAEPLPPEFFNAPGKDPHGLATTLRASCPVRKINHPPGAEAYVVTTPQIGHSEVKAPLENVWTEGPNTKTVISSGPARVFKIEGPLDPSTCVKLGEDSFQG